MTRPRTGSGGSADGGSSARRSCGEAIHGTAVSCGGRALLILGRSGAGKSALALDMIALGARLIADDLVALSVEDGAIVAGAPGAAPAEERLIEARGVGLLRAPASPPAPVALVLDLDQVEEDRLPLKRITRMMGVDAPLLRRPKRLSPAALIVALRHGAPVDPDEALAPKATSNQFDVSSSATRVIDGVFE